MRRAWLLLLICPIAQATTRTAATCNKSDVQTTVTASADGDTVIIPTTGSPCTWTSGGITISAKGLDITGTGTPNTGGGTFGAGTPSTKIIDNAGAPIFTFENLVDGQTAKVELLELSAAGAGAGSIPAALSFQGTCDSGGCGNIRVDNILFTAGTWNAAITGGSGTAGLILEDNLFGVIDHTTNNDPGNTAFLLMVNYSAWKGVGDYGDNSFESVDTFGTAQAIYEENNILGGLRAEDNDSTAINGGQGGARFVVRFNQWTAIPGDGMVGAHGTSWWGRPRGMRQVESYYNTGVAGAGCNTIEGILSGTGYFLSNVSSGTGCNAILSLDIARLEMSSSPWNNCDGTQPWDQTPFTSSTECLDQPGSGPASDRYQNSTPVLASAPGTPCSTAGQCYLAPTRDPIYEAGEDTSNHANPAVQIATAGTSGRVLNDRDYYQEVSTSAQSSATSPFNGTTGTGYGTLARRPTTCTTGVGYWATDQGTWNTFDNTKEGVLYKCTSTNTWGVLYTPYTYPHPLETVQPPAPASSMFVMEQ